MPTDTLPKTFYLGDSVYAEYDGWRVTLTTNNGFRVSNRIVLEPEVYYLLEFLLSSLRDHDTPPLTKEELHALAQQALAERPEMVESLVDVMTFALRDTAKKKEKPKDKGENDEPPKGDAPPKGFHGIFLDQS